MTKGFMDFFTQTGADVFCVQETKMQKEQSTFDFGGYYEYWNSAVKKGYAGTAVFTKEEPSEVAYGIGVPEHDGEGRVITLEFNDFYLVNVYAPNSQHDLARLGYRMEWEDSFRGYLTGLGGSKTVVVCGDLNVAHNDIDVKNAKRNRMNAGFTDEERGKFAELLAAGFADTFRRLYPNRADAYTWWSYIGNARAKNVGWRIDYFLISERDGHKIKEAEIYSDILGSDHCPVGFEF